MKNKITTLIHQVAILNKKNEEISKSTGSRFNMFKICGVNHYENTHSTILAELLNPCGTHGLKHSFLQAFIQTLGLDFKITHFNYTKAKVKTEMSCNNGRIDIAIKDELGNLIMIENKVYAEDGIKQLIRYEEFARNNFKDYQLIYLTLFGDFATEQSSKGVEYTPISYSETIINWLEKCVEISARFPIVRETIVQYINHLKYLTNKDMDYINQEEITKVLANANQLKAVKAIAQNYNKIFDELSSQHFNPKMEEFCRCRDLEFDFIKAQESYIRFEITKKEWGKNFCIAFSYDKSGYYYGVISDPILDYFSGIDKEQFLKFFKNKDYQNVKTSSWWPVYIYRSILTVDDWEDIIIASDEFLKDCQNKIVDILEAINNICQ